MKYLTAGVVFSEIPDEITLELGITNCPFNCDGCHSPFLQADVGVELDASELKMLLDANKGVSCVLFSGGDANFYAVEQLCVLARNFYPKIKTAWYSGRDNIPEDLNLEYFDYIKIGQYKKDLGGLKSPTTNQRLFKIEDGKLVDITSKFWK
jgi:anaerobic ribonucleoside-triphosphate reductase activating protein